VHLAEGDAVQTLDERAYALERSKLRAEAMCQRSLQQRQAQTVELAAVQLRWPAWGHRAQRVDPAFIELRLPCVCRLPRHAHRMGSLRWCLASEHQPTCTHSFACGFVHSRHDRILLST
jgi:hypothetical protein